MPKVYRLMKSAGDRPQVGTSSTALGVRAVAERGISSKVQDIPVDTDGSVKPGTGGMSVFDALAALQKMPVTMVPRRLRQLVPGAVGSNNVFVWTTGEGPFTPGPLVASLLLRLDVDKPWHGFVEPDAIMSLDAFQQALAATAELWRVEET